MSVILALEWSTRRLSVATRSGNAPPEISVLDVDRFHGPAAITLLEQHLLEHEISLAELQGIVIGRGPGNFSGIRLAFAWAAGCMAPGGIRLTAYSSGRVMAERLLREQTGFHILGDARRGKWWGCAVQASQIGDWELHPPELWRQRIGPEPVFSSEAARLNGLHDLREVFPLASDLLQTRQPPEPGQPLYLHPAV